MSALRGLISLMQQATALVKGYVSVNAYTSKSMALNIVQTLCR
jgi:hypothetical protein